jgi:3-methylcrotonyl-CoA carboxylase alpha subunit
MFSKILIANRGEIACRIIRTCRRLGVQTVAIGSDVDRAALHMRGADEAYVMPGKTAQETYLNSAAIIQLAQDMGCQAIHPGYGFLSENASFARGVAAASLVFIGPTPEAIEIMGSKSQAKNLAENLKIPTIPGYHGDKQEPEFLLAQASSLGFPILIKAAMGGGGKGMRLVKKPGDFLAALSAAQRESLAAFADARVLLEKAVEGARHIEVQILADEHQQIFTLGTRDCSLQRRHQKIIEEAPAAGLLEGLVEDLSAAARQLAATVGYVNAGTVEFLVEGNHYYFLEMNTRLQVEHPVTEMVFGRDLVEAQLRVACGEKLPWRQAALQPKGHAIEVRLCAEDPTADFLPSGGRLQQLVFPPTNASVRVDAGYDAGDSVPPYYDSLLAKVIIWGRDRNEACMKLQRALGDITVEGVKTTGDFLLSLLQSDFAGAPQNITFLDQWLARPQRPIPWQASLLGAMAYKQHLQSGRQGLWKELLGWRLNSPAQLLCPWGLSLTLGEGGTQAILDGISYQVVAERWQGEQLWLMVDQQSVTGQIAFFKDRLRVLYAGEPYCFKTISPEMIERGTEEAEGHLMAPMPGRVISVLVKPGEILEKATPLMILEAMKMEHTIRAPFAGKVATIFHAPGDYVSEGAELLEMVVV